MKLKFNTIGKGKPVVAVIGCVHGDEIKGEKVIQRIEEFGIENGTLLTFIANPKALKAKRRFIDSDLNRSFPGNKKGGYEEQMAYTIKKIIRKCDYVIDIHFTTTDVSSLVIVTKFNKKIYNLINMFYPKRVALMKKSIGKNGLIHYCRAGISFEYGKNGCRSAFRETLRDIRIIFGKIGMTDERIMIKRSKTDFYKIIGTVPKKVGYQANKNIKNFVKVKKGGIVAKCGNRKLVATKNFYPILFGEKAYKDIFGFAAKKVKKI